MILHIDTIYRIWALNFFPSFHSWNRHGLWADIILCTSQNLCFFLPWPGPSVIISSDAELGFSGFLSWPQWAGFDLLDEVCQTRAANMSLAVMGWDSEHQLVGTHPLPFPIPQSPHFVGAIPLFLTSDLSDVSG